MLKDLKWLKLTLMMNCKSELYDFITRMPPLSDIKVIPKMLHKISVNNYSSLFSKKTVDVRLIYKNEHNLYREKMLRYDIIILRRNIL